MPIDEFWIKGDGTVDMKTIHKHQIQTLQKQHWRKKKIKLFMFGVYAFYHPCLACLEQGGSSSIFISNKEIADHDSKHRNPIRIFVVNH